MKALVKTAPGSGNMQLKQVPVPEPKEDEVLVRVKACGVCGTDLKIQDGTFSADTPVIVGHEFAGVIEKTGSAVKTLGVGDRAAFEQHSGACGVCRFCLTGRRHLCPHKRSPGYKSDGGFAQYVCIQACLAHKLPENISFPEAASLEPMAIAAHALLEKTGLKNVRSAVILGCGAIALLALQILKASGVDDVYVVGIDADEDYRFGLAESFGASQTINAAKADPAERIAQLCGGADLVIDLSGAPAAILQGMDMLAKDAKFCAVGLPHERVCIDWQAAVMKAIEIIFSFSSGYEAWEKCISLVSKGKVELSAFTKDIYSLDDWEAAFKAAAGGKALKVIIQP